MGGRASRQKLSGRTNSIARVLFVGKRISNSARLFEVDESTVLARGMERVMQGHKGYYSLIQYCPDLGRRESVNIGVLLLCPELSFMKALTDVELRRVCDCFAPTDAERREVEAMRESIERRLIAEASNISSLDDLISFVRSRGNAIQLTEPRPTKVNDPEKDLGTLFTQLVEPPTHALGQRSGFGHQTALATISSDKGFPERAVWRSRKEDL